MEINENLILHILQLALNAGKAIIEIYNTPFNVEFKSDNSPLTIADKTAHSVIFEGLSGTGLPILSEEGAQTDYTVRKNWTQYWLVDPLDGTKEFIGRNGEFTVNIALISERQPILGIVYAPVQGLLFWGSQAGSFRLDVAKHGIEIINYVDTRNLAEKLPLAKQPRAYLVLGSRSHMNAETHEFIETLRLLHPDLTLSNRGSSLKFCTLAEGSADVYPRFGPTMEWDTAAGHAVACFAGCTIEQVLNGLPLFYNKPDLLNPHFIAWQKK